jgi:hypothetical protein
MTNQQAAANRIHALLAQPTDIGSIEDLLADLIHYCNSEGMDFYDLLNGAEQYVTEDAGMDAEITLA